ncbi:MAG TPA: selenoneine biosynthesis selenosugar synthase SenB [Gemmataceae bacterium]|nr:selenoneine biosynthesis selenosugar synthase SenB [Gemmataceae bacterium]
MKITLITPAPPGSRKGNRVTAVRWARLLRQLGHRVTVRQAYRGEPCDVLVALHARRSFAAVRAFRRAHPDRPVLVALTGTDLYDEIHTSPIARRALEEASRLIVLQPLGIAELPEHLRPKARVIIQSAEVPRGRIAPRKGVFEVCVLGHLRPVKDPFRTARAARLLPPESRLRVLHVGGALSPAMEKQARAEAAVNPRYRWLGDLPRSQALRVLARCRLLVLTSRLEGGANVVSEAIAAAVPVISSRIAGSVGLLGADYPGYFPVGNTRALAALLHRAETNARFYNSLKAWCRRLRPLVRPARERESWRRLLRELRDEGER